MTNQVIEAGPYQLSYHNRTLVMGILNVTPDSFSDGGKYDRIDRAVRHARQLAQDGADIIDIGGESTRPGAEPVSLEEELERVLPVIEVLTKEIDLPLSVDTYKAEVARQAIRAGAHIINDVWGAKKDPEMAHVAAELDVPLILMHNRREARYHSLVEEVCGDLLESVRLAKEAGVKDHNIILDPGIGFAKNYEENLIVMRNLHRIVQLGYPVLLGTSRKSMIGRTLGLPPQERMEGTAATVAFGITKGCQIVRVHDVKQMVRVCRMMDALVYESSVKEA
ncbi:MULTISPECIES: dihydropteroate synthase [Thermoactinomyces]|jgi:dihydropteroate synthase|uniref:Dihydropteroate synthase n=1 Tax=Thermoactinomyces daqus TaxID=1329516 RepID=A0A7W1X9F9_9BACL|nr:MULTISPECIES: dihydropteroate synthase [Thermoactinomyces]MBA4542424.1 dihydropteroate synthase [Thermoactinomyces daqus]MBH8598787.1 dihydropteroate synthase [Thermoactinomyces sp. CICC 10523]MBH8604772.1 dihydropteroate synthase [Thermoactinomyces sp. CICC 10522]MBH8607402.1 dihydropteroate synthase [Thermoactinomyces sp. CICC 10521]